MNRKSFVVLLGILSLAYPLNVQNSEARMLAPEERMQQVSEEHEEVFSALLPGSVARGKGVFKRTCKGCHFDATRFKAYKKAKIKAAQKSQPMMAGVKLTAQQMVDLVTYFSKIK